MCTAGQENADLNFYDSFKASQGSCRPNLQSVWNAVARLVHVANSSPRHHTGPAIAAPAARQPSSRVQAYTVGVGDPRSAITIPSYLASEWQLATAAGRRHIHSLDVPIYIYIYIYIYTLTITRTSTRFGDRCFQSPAARLWNRFPAPLRQPDMTYRQFTRRQKSHLFSLDCDTETFAARRDHILDLLTYLCFRWAVQSETGQFTRH